LEQDAVSSEPTPIEPTPQEPKQRPSVHDRRLTRQQAKPNRSQVKAAQTRASQQSVATTATSATVATAETASELVPTTSTSSRVKLTAAQRRALERGGANRGTGAPVGVAPITRAQEMFMIREDLRLLLIIAGSLLIGMVVLLFFID
jgi:outer membrane biosynthesis protein TonB